MSRFKKLFSDVEFLASLLAVTGILVFFVDKIQTPNDKVSLTFFGTNPFSIKEDILNQFQNVTTLSLEVFGGLVFLSKFFLFKNKVKKKTSDYILIVAVSVPLAIFLNVMTKQLAKFSYQPKLLAHQREAVLISINQIKANGTINAQNVSPNLISQETRLDRIREARLNLMIACEIFELICREDISNQALISKIEEQYRK